MFSPKDNIDTPLSCVRYWFITTDCAAYRLPSPRERNIEIPACGGPLAPPAAHGYVLVMATSDAHEAQEGQILNDLAKRQVDGLIISTVLPPSGFHSVALPGRPTVLINCRHWLR
jgi:hypothetical protein